VQDISGESTMLLEWDILVVVLRITGVSNFSLISNAAAVKFKHSSLSEGSNIGILANLAYSLLSCSFWELCMPGSSAVTIRSPPLTPVSAIVISGSDATFKPTCFVVNMDLLKPIEAPTAISRAVFSFIDQFTIAPPNFDRNGRISELGVPG